MSQEKNKKIKLEKGETYFNAAARIGDYLYYSAKYTNGLFRADLKTGKSEFITVFDTDREMDIHRFAFSVRNEVWFIPNRLSEKIAIFNVDSLELEYMDIPEPKKKVRDGFLFVNPIIRGELVWLVPGVYGAFLCLDTRNRTAKKIELPLDDFEKIPIIQGVEFEDKIYLCPWDCNKIFYLDLLKEEVQAIDSELPKCMYRNIVVANYCLYLVPREISNDILIIDLNDYSNSRKKIRIGEVNTLIVAVNYDCDRNQIIFFPNLKEKCIYILHMDTFEVEQIRIEYDIDSGLCEKAFWRDIVKISEDTFFVIPNDIPKEIPNYKSTPILECHNQEFKTFILEEPEDLVARKLLSMIETKEQKKEQLKEQEKIGKKIYQIISSDAP